MGKLQEFDITFTNNKVVYGPGESISGTVKIRTGSSLQYKGKKKKKKKRKKKTTTTITESGSFENVFSSATRCYRPSSG